MSQPTNVTLTVIRGDDQAWDLTFDQPVANFAAIQMTFREGWATTETDDTEASLKLSLADGDITATGTYTARVEMTSADSLSLVYQNYVHDVQVTMVTTSKRHTTQRGPVRVTPDVTRS